MIYGNIDATSWSVREIPPAGYSNAMNIARRDKRRTNSDGTRWEKGRERERERERGNGRGRERDGAGGRVEGRRARVKDTRKGFLVVYSVCKMSGQACTRRVPSSSRKGKRKRKDAYPCVWIIRCIESREQHRNLSSPITQCQIVVGERWEVMIWKRNV